MNEIAKIGQGFKNIFLVFAAFFKCHRIYIKDGWYFRT